MFAGFLQAYMQTSIEICNLSHAGGAAALNTPDRNSTKIDKPIHRQETSNSLYWRRFKAFKGWRLKT